MLIRKYSTIKHILKAELESIRNAGTFKIERVITSAQGLNIKVKEAGVNTDEICLCANNYLGLSNHPKVKQNAKDYIDSHGAGLSSVRFICGTQVYFTSDYF